jgi:hypothetical protein
MKRGTSDGQWLNFKTGVNFGKRRVSGWGRVLADQFAPNTCQAALQHTHIIGILVSLCHYRAYSVLKSFVNTDQLIYIGAFQHVVNAMGLRGFW